jgi:hypothetical protein
VANCHQPVVTHLLRLSGYVQRKLLWFPCSIPFVSSLFAHKGLLGMVVMWSCTQLYKGPPEVMALSLPRVLANLLLMCDATWSINPAVL